jgi:hypothetical protein
MAQFLTPAFLQASDASSNPLVGAKEYIYAAGTTTLLSLFSNEALTTPLTNPLVADAAGVFPGCFIAETKFKVLLKTSADVLLYSRDPVYSTGQADNVLASNVSFDGSGIGFSSTDVQAAIVELFGSVAHLSGADFLGPVSVTGDLKFQANDSLSNPTVYAALSPTVTDNVDGTEDGKLDIKTIVAGSLAPRLSIAQGVYASRAIGGDQGRDTTNLGTMFVNGIPGSAKMLAGLKVQATSATQVQVTASGGLSVTAAISTAGLNGLDTGAEAASTWYHVYVIWNGATAAALLSLSATAPTMPAGYTQKIRVGAVRNDASSNLWRSIQYGNRAQVIVGTNPTTTPVIASGSNAAVYTAASISAFVPPTAGVIWGILIGAASDNTSVGVAPNANYGAYNSSTNGPPVGNGNGGITGSTIFTNSQFNLVLESTDIYYSSSKSTAAVTLTGWEDNI